MPPSAAIIKRGKERRHCLEDFHPVRILVTVLLIAPGRPTHRPARSLRRWPHAPNPTGAKCFGLFTQNQDVAFHAPDLAPTHRRNPRKVPRKSPELAHCDPHHGHGAGASARNESIAPRVDLVSIRFCQKNVGDAVTGVIFPYFACRCSHNHYTDCRSPA